MCSIGSVWGDVLLAYLLGLTLALLCVLLMLLHSRSLFTWYSMVGIGV